MPYMIKGHAVVKKDSGKVVGHSGDPKKYLRTLQAIEHGWKPTNPYQAAVNRAKG